MTISGIQGQQLEVTVAECIRLKDTEFISKQDPYVYVEYGDAKYKTRTCTYGGKNPTFHDKFNFTVVEHRQEINVQVWNSNTFSADDYICSGRVPLLKVLREGYEDSCWPLQCKNGRNAGEIRLILRCPNLNKHPHNQATPVPSCPSPPPPSAPPVACPQPPPSAYPSPPVAFCPYHGPSTYPTVYHPPPVPMSFYPPAPYPPQPAVYQPPPFPPPPATYPPAPYPGQCSGAHPPY